MNYTLIIKKQIKINNRFETIEEQPPKKHTEKNIYYATCEDTLRFFRQRGEQRVVRKGDSVILYDYNGEDKRKVWTWTPTGRR